MKTWWRCCSDLSVLSCGVPSNDESPDWGRGFTLQLPAGHCHQPNIVLIKAVNSFIQPRDYPELRQLDDSYHHHLVPAICWTFLTRYIMPPLPVSQHKLCGHARLVSCEKFQPFWDCFNELFIKPITSPQESQTSPICRVLSPPHRAAAADRVRDKGQGF